MAEGAKLSSQGEQSHKTLTRGSMGDREVAEALVRLDTNMQHTFIGGGGDQMRGPTFLEAEEFSEDSEWSDGELEYVLASIEEEDLNESAALEMVDALASEEDQRKKGPMRRSWRDAQKAKRDSRASRKFWGEGAEKPPDRAYARPRERRDTREHRDFKKKLPIEELIKVTRCDICNEKGHWKRDCPQKKQASAAATSGGTMGKNYLVCLDVDEGGATGIARPSWFPEARHREGGTTHPEQGSTNGRSVLAGGGRVRRGGHGRRAGADWRAPVSSSPEQAGESWFDQHRASSSRRSTANRR